MEAGVPEDDKQTREWRYVVVDKEGGEKAYARLVGEGGTPTRAPVEQVPTPLYDTSYPGQQPVMWDPKNQGKYGLVPSHGP